MLVMAVAHIIIQVVESESGDDHHVNMTYSGGSDLINEIAADHFNQLLENITDILSGGLS